MGHWRDGENRLTDLREIYALWEQNQIDGMYTSTLGEAGPAASRTAS